MILADLAAGVKREYDVEVIYFTGSAPLLTKFEEKGVPVKKLPMKGRVSYRTYSDLTAYLNAEEPDIVHTHLYRADIYGVLAARKAKVPVVISTKHNTDEFRKKGGLWVFIDRVSMKRCSKLIAVSNAIKDFFIKYEKAPENNWVVIYNGVDLNRFNESISRMPDKPEILTKLELDPGLPTVGTISRLTKQKGQIYLIKSVEQLSKLGVRLNLIIAGDGPDYKFLSDYISEHGLGRNIKLLGFVPDITHILKAIDIFVYPSLWEGFGVAIIEAQAAGIPVIASGVDGIEEIITHEKNGFLVPPGSSSEISLQIRKLLKSPELSSKISLEAIQTVKEKFSMDRFIDSHLRLYA